MNKEKKRTRGSSVVDSSDLEQPNISAEFSDFVRSAFDKVGVKMDNIITGQQALEVKLDLVNQQVKSNKGDIEKLKKTAVFVSEQLTQAIRETKENVKKTADIDKDVDILMNKMQSLEAEVNVTERYSRSYNARFLGVPEITGEQCALRKLWTIYYATNLASQAKQSSTRTASVSRKATNHIRLLCGSSPAKYELLCSERRALVCDRTVFVLSTT